MIKYACKKETVEAEIKLFMLPQRACVGVSQVENNAANGPPRAQSNEGVYPFRVFCDVMMCVNRQGYVSILLSARLCRESRWYRG